MHVLYIHKNFPAQFGHVGYALAGRRGWKVTFLSQKLGSSTGPFRRIRFRARGGATRKSHFACASIENYVWNSHAVYDALKSHPEIRPDIIVSHSGFGTTLFLRKLYDVPIVHFCEWFYRDEGGDTDFFPGKQGRREISDLRSRGRNAMLLADLENCTLGYSPTHWQRSRLPHEYQYKLETIFDGIDTDVWRPLPIRGQSDRTIAGKKLPNDKKIVTYVSRGFESMRGFDVFMQIARAICARRNDVVFLCIGSDRVCYSGDLERIPEASFREHVLKRGSFDLERFIFTGAVPPQELFRALVYSDLHIYLTAPFILSWSVMNALACGCTVLASDTAPLREVIDHGRNGLLAPYWDVERFVELACHVLDEPESFRSSMGQKGMETIHTRYSLERVLPQMIRLYQRAVSGDVPPPGTHVPAGALKGFTRNTTVLRWAGPLRALRSFCRWPAQPLRKQRQDAITHDRDWLLPERELQIVQKTLPGDASLLLELGSWRGDMTMWLVKAASRATIISVDEWSGAEFPQPDHPSWKTLLADVWQSFVANCWLERERIIPLKDRHDLAVRRLHALGVGPDVVLIHPDYDTFSVAGVLNALAECYPRVPWVGLNWSSPNVQQVVTKISRELHRPMTVQSTVWRLDPDIVDERQASRSSETWESYRASPADNSALLAAR